MAPPQLGAWAAGRLSVKYPTLSFDGDPYHIRPSASGISSRMVFSECGNGYSTVSPVFGSKRPTTYDRISEIAADGSFAFTAVAPDVYALNAGIRRQVLRV
jgi:hypothetical protein